ncbi:MAG: hypothetical protein ABI777_04455 [Betaproteobacteria bacterium]
MSFNDFMKSAWDDHADHADQVAARLAESMHVVENAEHIPRYAGLVTHVYGEHLGQWDRGVTLLQTLQRVGAHDDDAAASGATTCGIAVLRYCAGDAAALTALGTDVRVAVLATASSALLGQLAHAGAITAYDDALVGAQQGLATGSPAVRALAIGGNNLAAAMERKADRTAAETAGMIRAAQAGLKYWSQAGTWLNVERGEYQLTRCLLSAGQYADAMASARRCLEVCVNNDAPAFEVFFGHAVLALAQRGAGDAAGYNTSRALALASYATVPADEQSWCSRELGELDA